MRDVVSVLRTGHIAGRLEAEIEMVRSGLHVDVARDRRADTRGDVLDESGAVRMVHVVGSGDGERDGYESGDSRGDPKTVHAWSFRLGRNSPTRAGGTRVGVTDTWGEASAEGAVTVGVLHGRTTSR
jgi:hypothetical protein